MRPHLMTRLDYDTSGILLVAKHRVATSMISRQVEHHQLHKTYLALVSGQLDQDHGVMNDPIKRVPGQAARVVAEDGQQASTEFWTLGHGDGWTAVKVLLHTGRTHQIRVHFAHAGHPLLGDQLYGGSTTLIGRQALHALSIDFHDPFSGRQVKASAAIPDDLAAVAGQFFDSQAD